MRLVLSPESPTPALKALCHYQAGICYSFLFREEQAKASMTQALKHIRKANIPSLAYE